MLENQNAAGSQYQLTVSPRGKDLLTRITDQVFNPELEEELPLIESLIKALDAQALGNDFEPQRIALESLWNFFDALRLVRCKGDFVKAREELECSEQGFNRIGQTELRDLSIGIGVYVEAITEVQSQNIGRALKLLREVKEYLQAAGKFSSKFKSLVDFMEPDTLFFAGVEALGTLDFADAKAYIEQASRSAEEVAIKYFKEGEPLYCSYQGCAHAYKALYTLHVALNEFSQFEYDKLAAEQDLTRDAVEAQELLYKGDTENVQVKNLIPLLNTIIQLLEVTRELAKMMQRVFSSTFKPDLGTFMALKQKVHLASESASEAGLQGAVVIRFCNQISDQVNNLERLAKPSKKDFGKFSGLVACGLFLPLFLIVSLVNFKFSMNLGQQTLVIISLVPALIGGFGFGALKFKSLLFPGANKES